MLMYQSWNILLISFFLLHYIALLHTTIQLCDLAAGGVDAVHGIVRGPAHRLQIQRLPQGRTGHEHRGVRYVVLLCCCCVAVLLLCCCVVAVLFCVVVAVLFCVEWRFFCIRKWFSNIRRHPIFLIS